jgi:hypothetical protein
MSSKPYRRDQLAFIVVVGTVTALVVGIIFGVVAHSVFFGACFAVIGFGMAALLCGLVFVILHALDRLSGGVISNPQNDPKVGKIIASIYRIVAPFLGWPEADSPTDAQSRRRIAELEEEVRQLQQALGEKQMKVDGASPTDRVSDESVPESPGQASSEATG